MANSIKIDNNYRYKKNAWLTELADPWEVSSYNSNNYYNFLGKDSSGYYETWVKISFPDITDMNTIKEIKGKARFEPYIDNRNDMNLH